MGLIEDLAKQLCEKNTGREGCASPSNRDHPLNDWCSPCLARRELGIAEPDRPCTNCGKVMVAFNFAGAIATGTDESGSQLCPAPLHSPHLFYDETILRGYAREHPDHRSPSVAIRICPLCIRQITVDTKSR